MNSVTLLVVGLVVIVSICAVFIGLRITRARRLPTTAIPKLEPDRKTTRVQKAAEAGVEPPAEKTVAAGVQAGEATAKEGPAAGVPQPSEDRRPGKPAEISVEVTEEEGEEPEAPISFKPEAAPRLTPSTRPLSSRPPKDDNLTALKKGLTTTRGGLVTRLAKLFVGRPEIKPELLEEIEEVLITADVGAKTSAKILSVLKSQMEAGELQNEESVWKAIRSRALEILSNSAEPFQLKNRPAVVLVVGVNGVGKTTTIGKLAHRLKADGKKVILVAGDTFRAAAVVQLEVWGRRVDCPVVKGKDQADPSSVVFDAVKKASDEGFDVVIVDTAGRLHTKVPLMEELKKVSRTATKALGGRPVDEILLVLDATIGQNAVQQAQTFRESLDVVSGIVLTKMDGTAKGGVILAIADENQIPVRFVGLGEKLEDLREFQANEFVEALFAKPENETIAT
jgi:fused signal recognition particle receptor